MNYYEHHLGDYMRDTAHLSMTEDAAYRRLLDAYYVRERPLPADLVECCKLARATTRIEREAVAYVVREFFQLADDGHHQARADAEIARFKDKQRKAKASADARWSQRQSHSDGNADGMRTHSDGNADGMHRAPVPSNQTPDPSQKQRSTALSSSPSAALDVGELEPDKPDPTPTPSSSPPVRLVNGSATAAAARILEFLNEKTGKRYRPMAGTLEPILARLKDGATESECRMIIANRCRAWMSDDRMRDYLRPATLFNRTKFAQYLGELGASQPGDRREIA